MKLSQLMALLPTLETLQFRLEDQTAVPEHFHITEVGEIVKNYIDCGGVVRTEKAINFQLWCAHDFEHRLSPTKLLEIITLSAKKLNLEDAPIEVEYQSNTIGKYTLAFDGTYFILQNKATACLAEDSCGIPAEKQEPFSIQKQTACAPNSGCC